jgi:glutamine synthetase
MLGRRRAVAERRVMATEASQTYESRGDLFAWSHDDAGGQGMAAKRALQCRTARNGDGACEALEFGRQTQAKMVDLKFTRPARTWQHMTLPIARFDESAFDEGSASTARRSAAGRASQESDMLLDAAGRHRDPRPVHRGADALDPLRGADPITREPYARTRAGVAPRAEEYLRSTRIADTAYFGPRASSSSSTWPTTCSRTAPLRGRLERGPLELRAAGLGYTVSAEGGLLPARRPHDSLHDIRTEMVLTLERLGIPCEFHHHEVATAASARSTCASRR